VNSKNQWIESCLEKHSAETPIFLLRGLTSKFRTLPFLDRKQHFLKKIVTLGLSNIFYWFAAEHPQYSGQVKAPIFSPDFMSFFRINYQEAFRHGIGLHEHSEIFFSMKHCSTCRVAEFQRIFETLPFLIPEFSHFG